MFFQNRPKTAQLGQACTIYGPKNYRHSFQLNQYIKNKNSEPVSDRCSEDNNRGIAYYQDLGLNLTENSLIKQDWVPWFFGWDLCYEEADDLSLSNETFGAVQLNDTGYDCFYFSRPISGISYQPDQILGIRCSDSPHCNLNSKKLFHEYLITYTKILNIFFQTFC